MRGGSWYNFSDYLQASSRVNNDPTLETSLIGFRIAMVPEPATLLLSVTAFALMCWFRTGQFRTGQGDTALRT